MILVDSNVVMYLVGAEHRHKIDARRHLERLVLSGERLVTDAEVLQEILHHFVAIRRREGIQPAFEALLGVVDEVFAVEAPDLQRAKEIVLASERFSARDAVHIAIMERRGIDRVLTFDRAFDEVPGIERIG